MTRLSQLATAFLTLDHLGPLRQVAHDLHSLLSQVAGIKDDYDSPMDPADTAPVMLPSGKAIDPVSAARCLLDFARTSKFLRGIHEALLAARQRISSRPVEVLYAGCGPLAPLAVPLMTRFAADEVRFTLLDVHQRSLDAARRIVGTFGFGAHVREYVCADAAAYRHPQASPPDIVIAETMQRALAKEPQVAVTLNLAPQLAAGGIFIPERIIVDACLFNPAAPFQTAMDTAEPAPLEHERTVLATLIKLDLESVPRLLKEGIPAVRARLPAQTQPPWRLMLRTRVTVFGSHGLDENDSGITLPHIGRELDLLQPTDEVEFRYRLGKLPGFEVHQS